MMLGTAAGVLAAAAETKRLRFGGPIFLKSDDPAELAREHRRLGYSAAYCPPAKPGETDRIRAIEHAFASENVVIAEVGAWRNMMDPDSAKRNSALEYVTERLGIADQVGSRCCVDYAGSFNPQHPVGPHPRNFTNDFFDATVENCRKVIDAVKPKRTKFTIEMEKFIQPNGPDSYLRLIRAVDRPAFAVHIDIVNIIDTPARFYDTGSVIRETFRKLGPWVTSCHAKDIQVIPEGHIHFIEIAPGKGVLDYAAYLNELAKLPVDAPLMLEHLKTAEEYDEAAAYVRKIAAAESLRFA